MPHVGRPSGQRHAHAGGVVRAARPVAPRVVGVPYGFRLLLGATKQRSHGVPVLAPSPGSYRAPRVGHLPRRPARRIHACDGVGGAPHDRFANADPPTVDGAVKRRVTIGVLGEGVRVAVEEGLHAAQITLGAGDAERGREL